MENKVETSGPALQATTELNCRHFRQSPGLWPKIQRLILRGQHGYYEIVEDRRTEHNRVVTDAFVAFLVDELQTETSEWGDFKYHDSGTGVGAEAAADTALGTACGESRDSGTQIEGATANIYKSVATHTYAGTFAITEHGLFSQSTGGTLMDRTKFTAINVVSTDKIEFTFQITFSAGG